MSDGGERPDREPGDGPQEGGAGGRRSRGETADDTGGSVGNSDHDADGARAEISSEVRAGDGQDEPGAGTGDAAQGEQKPEDWNFDDQQSGRAPTAGPGQTDTGEPFEARVADTAQEATADPGDVDLSPEEIQAYTTDRRSLAPRVQLQWAIRTTIGTTILGFLMTAALTNFAGVDPLVAPVVLGAIIATGLMWVILRYRVWVYQIREDAIYLERGVVTHVRTLVPYVRIQHVDTSQGPLERALGLSTLVVYTAGSRGADVSIPGLRPDEARDLQQRVKELAIDADGGDAL